MAGRGALCIPQHTLDHLPPALVAQLHAWLARGAVLAQETHHGVVTFTTSFVKPRPSGRG